VESLTVQAGRPPPQAQHERGAPPPEQARPHSLPLLTETPKYDPQQEQAMEFVIDVFHPGLQHLSFKQAASSSAIEIRTHPL
jgi:hypothetical protein